MNVLTTGALRLAAAIREGEVTSREVVEAHVERLRETHSRLNAVVVPLYEEALEAADRADAADAPAGPLHGVPCTIKESIAVAGQPNASGLVARRDVRATETAPSAQALLDAGAIPLGLTNTSELCMWMESSNRVYGRTNNAYDPTRTAGGSSGGEGAAVGVGGAPFGLGSDVGGSIRVPSFVNGVFGHMPTPRLVSTRGMWPPTSEDVDQLLRVGPLCRRSEDLMPLLRILAGREDLGEPRSVSLEGLQVLVSESAGPLPVRADVRNAVRRAALALERMGAEVQTRRMQGFTRAFELWAAALGTLEPTPWRELLGHGDPRPRRQLVWELARGRSDHTFPSVVLALLEAVKDRLPGRTQRFVEMGRSLQDEVSDALGDGVLLYPPFAKVAPRHNVPLLNPFGTGYLLIFNVLGLPVTQVPLGLTEAGLPTGVQVAAAPGNDHVSIAVAGALERSGVAGWVPPRDLLVRSFRRQRAEDAMNETSASRSAGLIRSA